MNEETGSVIDFAYTIFSGQPGEEKSLHLKLDYSHLKTVEEIDEFKFKVLVDIFVAGCKIKFGNTGLSLKMIREEKLKEMRKYFNSFGYKLYIDIVEPTGAMDDQKLRDRYLRINSGGVNYYIHFDNL